MPARDRRLSRPAIQQTADHVAQVIAWLLGDGAARLTGQVIAVDSGFTTVRPLVK
jgi:enoyl-[acyl-carrier-protein] reductase (NADH)